MCHLSLWGQKARSQSDRVMSNIHHHSGVIQATQPFGVRRLVAAFLPARLLSASPPSPALDALTMKEAIAGVVGVRRLVAAFLPARLLSASPPNPALDA